MRGEEISSWVDRFLSGELKRTLVSELEDGAEALEEGTVRMVGSSFDRVVHQQSEGKDVFVFFHSPHCGSSVAARPFWKALVAALRVLAPSMVLADADGWANDWPLDLSGLPDFRLFPADDKARPKRYTGPREVAAAVAWLRDMAFNEVGRDEL